MVAKEERRCPRIHPSRHHLPRLRLLQLCLLLQRREVVGTSYAQCIKVPKVKYFSTSNVIMVATVGLWGTRIRYACLLVHLVSGYLDGGVDEVGNLCGRYSHGFNGDDSVCIF
jgi:hypothetical protein